MQPGASQMVGVADQAIGMRGETGSIDAADRSAGDHVGGHSGVLERQQHAGLVRAASTSARQDRADASAEMIPDLACARRLYTRAESGASSDQVLADASRLHICLEN